MVNFQRFMIAILIVAVLVLAPAAAAYANVEPIEAPQLVVAEEEEGSQGAPLLIIMIGLGAVAAVGGYYIVREYGLSKNNN